MSSWRRRVRGWWWIFFGLLPFGQLAWIPLVKMGVRAKRRSWVAFGIGYLAVQAVAWPVFGEAPQDSTREWVGFSAIMGSWIAAFGHAIAVRGSYREATHRKDPELERAEARVQAREQARTLAREDPHRALELGVGRPDLPDTFDAGLVDLNHAPAHVIRGLDGVEPELAERVVRVREEVNGFESLEDAAALLDLPAPLVDRIRRDVVVLPRGFEEDA